MSKPTPKDKDKKTPPEEIDTGAIKVEFDWGESKVDDGIKKAFQEMQNQNKEQFTLIKQQNQLIQDMNTKSAMEDYETERKSLLETLEAAKPGMAEKYKDEKDLGLIKNAIKVLSELKKGDEFEEVEGRKKDLKDDDILTQHWRPPGTTKPTSKLHDYMPPK
ncbi:hypothetical protein LCGC14_1107310 [marine sediment metagenome]|uniref:Uncharacterized protein n=1 Tax=marine sediment metagenome TaxID=412755 RepID=A0A0F9MVM4_9ZZZZ